MKIIMYVTPDHGNGVPHAMGEYEDWEDIEVVIGMFAPEVVITFEVKYDEKEKV